MPENQMTQFTLVKIADITAIKRIEDGYFNATEFLKAFNDRSSINTQMASYKKLPDTKYIIDQLKTKQGISLPMATSRGCYGCTWMHPIVFIDFTFWLDVKMRYEFLNSNSALRVFLTG